MKRIFTILAAIVCFCACEKNDKSDYDVQPDIPMYDQLLLKGNVKTVNNNIASEFGTSTESIIFDQTGKLTYYALDGEEQGSSADLRCSMFPPISGTYANFVFPNDWTICNNMTITHTSTTTENGNVTHEVEKKIEYEWDRGNGRFTKVRCYINNEPAQLAGIENGYDIEEYLYYSNGLPHYDFTFDGNPHLITELSYDNFDENGNPLVINISIPNGDLTITRQIEYY